MSVQQLTGKITDLERAIERLVHALEHHSAVAAGGKSPGGAREVQTFADYIRQTQTLTGAINTLVYAMQKRNEGAGIQQNPATSLLSGAAGQGWFANVARGLMHKAAWNAGGKKRGAALRQQAAKVWKSGSKQYRGLMRQSTRLQNQATKATQAGKHRLANALKRRSAGARTQASGV